jgi:putative ABC transport system permease protein
MLREFRFAFRALAKQPGFTAIAVLTIALGVGANSAIFTVVDAVMLRPLPFHDADRVVILNERTPNFPLLTFSAENFRDVCHDVQALQACGAFRNFTINMSGGTEPERVNAKMLSANVLPMLGATPVVGRTFTAAEDGPGGEPVAMISSYLWHALAASPPCSASGSCSTAGRTRSWACCPRRSGCSSEPTSTCRSAGSSRRSLPIAAGIPASR